MIRVGRISQLVFTALMIVLGGQSTFARIATVWPIDYVVLKSELIIQGRVEEGYIIVEKVFLGESSPGTRVDFASHIDLTFIVNRDYCAGGPSRNLKGTSAVVFLHRENPTLPWQVTGEGSGLKWLDGEQVLGYYQMMNPGPLVLLQEPEAKTPQDLNRVINLALEKRRRYVAALSDPDPQKRIQGLRPFLSDSKNGLYWRDAIHSLAATGPVAGKALRELAEQPSNLRFIVVAAMGEAGDPDCVPFLSDLVEKARPFLTDLKFTGTVPEPRQTFNEWQTALCALAKIDSPKAHSVLLESMSEWPAAEEFYGAQAGMCIQQGLNNHPRAEDLAYFQRVYSLYPRWYAWDKSGSWASWLAMGFLEKHKFKEAIPLLVQQLDHPDAATRDEAVRLLREIVGTDLGESKEAWLGWYQNNQKRN